MTRSMRALRAAAMALRTSNSTGSVRPMSYAAAARATRTAFGPSPHLRFPSPIAGPSSLRALSTSSVRHHGDLKRPEPGTGIKVTYQDSKGNVIKTVEGNEGDDLLSLAHEHDIDLEGACERSVACSTCHVIISPEYYDLLPDPEDDENDMLDLAFGLEDTSRLGCQVLLKKELDGIVARLPSATRNMYVDGAKARTH